MEIISKAGPLTVYRTHPVNWSAILAGWLLATAVAWLLYVLGLAVGFSAVDHSHAESMTHAWGAGTRTWLVLTWAVSLFMGGLFASWIDGKAHSTHGLLNGITVWGLTTTVGVILLSLGFANALQGGASLLQGRTPTSQTSMVQQLHAAANAVEDDDASPAAKARAERIAKYTAGAMWALFFSSIAGAFSAALGGWLGAGHLHRVYDDEPGRHRLPG
jgi:hypothetical protein